MSAISKSSKGSKKEKENKEGRKKSPSRRVELDSDENTNSKAFFRMYFFLFNKDFI